MAFYSPHSGRALPKHGVSRMYYRTTKKPHDITSWGGIHALPSNSHNNYGSKDLGYTYSNPIDLGKGKVWLAWRGGNWNPTSAMTYNYGKTWTKAKSFIKSPGLKRPYVKYAKGLKNSIYMAYNQDNPGTTNTGQYFMKFKPGHGYFKANGKKIAGKNSTVDFRKGDKIMSGRRHGRAYVMDVASDKQGHPAVVFTAKPRHKSASIMYSKFDGKKWRSERITSTGYGLYNPKIKPKNYGYYPTAGVSLDRQDPSIVYLSRLGKNRQMKVERWQKQTDGKWDTMRISPEGKSCVRPVGILGDKLGYVAMMCGRYTDWLNYNTSIYLAKPKLEPRNKTIN